MIDTILPDMKEAIQGQLYFCYFIIFPQRHYFSCSYFWNLELKQGERTATGQK